MDIFAQQKKLYTDPHFGHAKRGRLEKFFESVKNSLTPTVVHGAKIQSGEIHMINQHLRHEDRSAGVEIYTILRNGIHHETIAANECACAVEIIALKKQYPQDQWSLVPGDAGPPKKQAHAAA